VPPLLLAALAPRATVAVSLDRQAWAFDSSDVDGGYV
jgi:hypothetical protein